ncbi:MAG TPA: tRNA (adenosine(37)-N6)-threonylcarbamoyltransferase complex dimerization subunit type 1 TsaB [Burkholderiales bacterium]|nr:tRNA (adenosine(37)-N6)-threonylcarbamoyltransferase complex dimerization subunit type 1 TsaB [Burkholderiales bacterium]
MNILAIDTSGEYCTLALWIDGEVLSREKHAGQNHSQVLLPLLNDLLAESGMSLKRLDGIAFGAGPGSFTGLRIACGVAQGLAFAMDLPVAGICTLEALAEAMPGRQVIASLDARMGEIYHAAYKKHDDRWQEVSPPALWAPLHAPSVAGSGWIGCGSGFAVYAEQLELRYQGQLSAVIADAVPRAREMARLAVGVLQRGEGCAAEAAAPLYLRDKVALKTFER